MNKLSILFVCGAGLGSSFAAQMSTEDVLTKLEWRRNWIMSISHQQYQ